MGYIVSAGLLLMGIWCHRNQRTWACPEALFCYEWALISFLASLRLFGLYEASWYTWIVILIGSISFIIGCLVGQMFKVKTYGIVEDSSVDRNIISERAFWIFAAVIIIYTSSDLFQSIHYMRLGVSLGDIRNASVGMDDVVEGYTRRQGALWEYIGLCVSVMSLLVTGYGIYEYIKGGQNKVRYIATVMIITLMQAFSYGGRFGLAYVIIELFVCMNINKVTGNTLISRMSVRRRKSVKKIAVLLAVVIVVITLIRGAEAGEVVKKYYRYICGDIIFFDLHLKKINAQSLWSCSFAGFYGWWAVILPILNRFGIGYPQIYLDTLNEIMDGQTFMKIGDGLVTNAFITPFYHPYADFRILGVILGMMFFGNIAGVLYKKVMLRRDGYSVISYLIIAQTIFKSLQLYPFSSKIYVLAFAIIWLSDKNFKFSLGGK